MKWKIKAKWYLGAAVAAAFAAVGCKTHMPHAFTWPAGGDTQYTHAKPPEGGYYSNWDPFSVKLEVTPLEDTNPVRTQHYLVATVLDKDGEPLPNRRVEWIINQGSVGDIVEVDESGWRASRGYKVSNTYAVSHTNNFDHVLDMGTDDTSDDLHLTKGQTWCVITSPIEGESYITVYAPGIYDTSQHKVFAVKHWYDVDVECPAPATNPTGTNHELVTTVAKHSDRSPLEGYTVTYKIVDGPAASFDNGATTITVRTDASGQARTTLKQTTPAEGTNNISIDVMREGDAQCCKPPVHIKTCDTSKTWIGPRIAISKTCTPNAMVGEAVNYSITVSNPSQVDATNVVVTDTVPDGIQYVSSTPSASAAGNSLTWSLGSIPGGGSTTINVQGTAARTGTFENCAEVRADQNLSDRACCQTVVTAPALVVEKSCPSEVILCDTIEYVITVRNTGDGVARNVRIEDALPDGVATTDGRTSVQQSIGDLGPGQAADVRITAKASRTGSFTNRVTAMADGGLSAQADCTTTVRQPMLSVTKTCPDQRYIGRPATFEITVTNNGDAPANNTMLTDNLPSGVQFNNASDGGTMSGNRVTWSLGTIEPGGSRKVSVTVTVTSAGRIENTVNATATCTEASARCEMSVVGVPAILLEVVDVEDPIEVGQNITYIITVTNQGSAEGTNIVLNCTLPAELDYVSAEGPVQGSASGKNISFAPLPSLAPRAKATYKVVAKGNATGDLRFQVSMRSDQMSGADVQETESTHVY